MRLVKGDPSLATGELGACADEMTRSGGGPDWSAEMQHRFDAVAAACAFGTLHCLVNALRRAEQG